MVGNFSIVTGKNKIYFKWTFYWIQNFRSTYQIQLKRYRQDELLDYYHFYCHCEACYENYSLATGKDIISYACLSLSNQFEQEQPFLTPEQIPSKYREYSDVLRRYKELYRANEFCMIQDMLLDSFYIICGILSVVITIK